MKKDKVTREAERMISLLDDIILVWDQYICAQAQYNTASYECQGVSWFSASTVGEALAYKYRYQQADVRANKALYAEGKLGIKLDKLLRKLYRFELPLDLCVAYRGRGFRKTKSHAIGSYYHTFTMDIKGFAHSRALRCD